MTTIEIESEIRTNLDAKRCADFRLVEGWTLILYFQAKRESDRITFWIECAWRLVDNGRMVIGSLDDPQIAVTELQRLRDHELTGVEVTEGTRDIQLSFRDNLMLQAFCYSVQDEQWELRLPDGHRIGIGPHLIPFDKWATST
ncbi:MAG: hypothetical protein K8T25_16875 [Planctomycetia bacterium]|nr:hypothetical protein [Planctomycetia bacterium]